MDKDYAKNANSITGAVLSNLAAQQHNAQGAALGNTQSMNAGASREMTVGDLIDRRIEKAERQARDLRVLKDAMSQGFLQSGASKISSLLEI